ncbi:MAG: hypothetical protein SGJ18_03100 [Pseudomonadota bacterium]|nr:hypothetical protein [Pseudomonadota bacterium]
MSQVFKNIHVDVDDDLEEKLKLLMPNLDHFYITRKSVDARRGSSPQFIYSVEAFAHGEPDDYKERNAIELTKKSYRGPKPIIIGAGPAGLFAAVRLIERGIPSIIFERGADAKTRIQHINRHWRYGELNPESNVCFGEGGAGLYSDGKLITRIKSPHIGYIMNRLVKFGAPPEIEYLSNPHVGSDRIRRVIPHIREFLISKGCEIYFNSKVTAILASGCNVTGVRVENGKMFESKHVVLSTGHSAEDVFRHLKDLGVQMEGKSFAIGLRIEHTQKFINAIQYREHAENKKLGAANYRLAHHDHKSGIGVYSFCMCPGGYTISSTTDSEGVVCNGMSNYARNGLFANSAVVVSVDHEKFFGRNPFGGLEFRRELEKANFLAVKKNGGTKQLPVQNTLAFIAQKPSLALPSSSPSGVVAVRLDEILPKQIRDKLCEGFKAFNQTIKGYVTEQSQLHGIESRTSCPIRITRDKTTLESLSHKGLYPCGEGAGYAGGITSAAIDGVRVADAIFETVK